MQSSDEWSGMKRYLYDPILKDLKRKMVMLTADRAAAGRKDLACQGFDVRVQKPPVSEPIDH
jgi:hypothetical protein